MRLRLLAIFLLLPHAYEATASPKYETEPQDISYCQLAGDPGKFSGKRIRIRAIYTYMFELWTLRPSSCCSEHDIGMWVDFDNQLEGESRKLFNKFPESMGFVLAVFVGTIETGDAYGTGQRVHFFVEHIEKVEQQANPPLGKFPAWIPHNCKAPAQGTPNSRLVG